MLKNIDTKVLKTKIGDINIIDIRSIEKYNSSHINTSINIPYNNLILYPEKYLNKNDSYYVYCQHGKTSVKVSILLNKLGYDVINVIGGYEAWLLN